MFPFSDFLYKSICCGYSYKIASVDAMQMGTHNICLNKEVDKKYTGCNLKTMELLDCALIRVCAVIRSTTVLFFPLFICVTFIIENLIIFAHDPAMHVHRNYKLDSRHLV